MSHDHRNETLLFDAAGRAQGQGSGLTFTFRPIRDRLLVRVIPQKDREWNGVILPAFAQAGGPHLKGEIIAAGPGRVMLDGTTAPMEVAVGQIVMFLRVQPEQVIMPSEPGTELMMIQEGHVLGELADLPKTTGVLAADGREVVAPGGAAS